METKQTNNSLLFQKLRVCVFLTLNQRLAVNSSERMKDETKGVEHFTYRGRQVRLFLKAKKAHAHFRFGIKSKCIILHVSC